MSQVKDSVSRGLSGLKIDASARRPPENRRRAGLYLAMALVAAVAVLMAIVATTRKAVVEVVTVRLPEAGTGSAILNASGYVTPRRRATVAAKITGRVKDILVEEGMQVRKGQVLARLDDSDARAALSGAQADLSVATSSLKEIQVNLEDAERTLKRIRELALAGYSDQQSLDRSQAARDAQRARLAQAIEQEKAAMARVEMARREIQNCTVEAPFDGVAVSKDAQPGEIVSPVSAGGGFTRTGISTIVDMSSLEIEVDVNESYIAKVSPGQRVDASLDAYPDWKIPASVRTIIPTADRQKATVKVRIAFDSLDPKMLPDMGVKVAFLENLEGRTTQPKPILIPSEAIFESGGSPTVLVVNNDKLEARVVILGAAGPSGQEVKSGLSQGERIVASGVAKLKTGQRVKVKGE